METATLVMTSEEEAVAAPRARAIPWRAWVAVLSVACLPIGLLWDISWHETIGRDTFWTPAHLMIQLGGIVPALTFAWLAFKTTFWGTLEERGASVQVWGFRAPLGAWVTMWGAATMVTSAPFDDWWHNTYGLDVKIISPPHTILGLGMQAVTLGVLLFVFSWQNRTKERLSEAGAIICAVAAGVLLTLIADFLTEVSFPNLQHSTQFYVVCAAELPLVLVMTAQAARTRWAATWAAATYMGVMLMMVWVLPLFPGHPKLAPIYNPVTHMVPPAFPLLLVLPAVGIDILTRLMRKQTAAQCSRWQSFLRQAAMAAGLAVVFLAIFIPTQWFFSIFLLSDAAENPIFARSGHLPYWIAPGPRMNHFSPRNPQLDFAGVMVAALVAWISCGVGLCGGHFLRKVQR